MKRFLKTLSCFPIPYMKTHHRLCLIIMASVLGTPILTALPNYAIFQLGNDGTAQNAGELNIQSNSSIFGSVLKGADGTNPTILIQSKVTGGWDIETGVPRVGSQAFAGSQSTLSSAAFTALAADAVSTSAAWANFGGTGGTPTNFTALAGGGGLTLLGGGGANVYLSTTDFKLTGNTALTLTGGANDLFIFNVPSSREFEITSHGKIVLNGIDPSQVLFNVLGGIEKTDAKIGGSDVLFAGTLLAPGRNVIVSQTHFDTFVSGGHPENVGGAGLGAPGTLPSTYAHELGIFNTFGYAGRPSQFGAFTTSGAGLFGQIIGGGKISSWTESDILYTPFRTNIPDGGSTVALLGGALTILAGLARRRVSFRESLIR